MTQPRNVLRLGRYSHNDSFKKFKKSRKYSLSTCRNAIWQKMIQCIRSNLGFSTLNRKTGLGHVELHLDEADDFSTGFPSRSRLCLDLKWARIEDVPLIVSRSNPSSITLSITILSIT